MEAKDTMMADNKLRELTIELDSDGVETGRYILAPFPELVRSVAQAQAEISFKAGIREVVEFTTREFGVDWSSEKEQLEVWGVDKPKK